MSSNRRAVTRSRGLPRATIVLTWTGVTVAYAFFLILRWSHRGQMPGLSSATAAGAIGACWLYLLRWHLQDVGSTPPVALTGISVLLLVVLAGTLTANVVVVVRRIRVEGSLPLVPAVATFCFGYVLRHVLFEVLGREKVRSSK